MIFLLKGILIAKNGLQIILDVSGVGYGVLAPMSTLLTLPELGQQVILHTHLISREDLQTLYGFATEKEKTLFCELIKISGLGGKLALAILSHLTVEQFIQTIQLKDLTKLINIPGVGQKIAQRLMIEMQNTLQHKKFKELLQLNLSDDKNITLQNIDDNITNDVQEALIALGYKPKEAMLAIKSVINNNKVNNIINNSSEHLLKATLKNISKVYYD